MIPCSIFYLIVSALAFSVDRDGHVAGTQVPRVRGIPISKNSLYNPDRDFDCLDGTKSISFERVNDDYCDCPDGSDEPGTAACPNGSFFCQNTGHRAKYLPSGFVNDGVCDCCDASDEWSSDVGCAENCHDLGREARIEAEKAAELEKEGNKIRIDMVALGTRLKLENKAKLDKLRTDFEEAGLTKKEKEILKNQAEERETAALEKYKVEEPEPAATEDIKEDKTSEAEDYFKLLDSDSSGTVSIVEMQTRITFDKDGNGEVSQEEALYFLNNKEELNLEDFMDFAWPNIKPFLMRDHGSFMPPRRTEDKDAAKDQSEAPHHPDEEDSEADGEEDHHDDEDHEKDSDDKDAEEPEKETEEPRVQYDDETQSLIDEANQARERYQESERSFEELQRDIRSLEEKIERDYGLEEEFASLDGECYEYRDLEYIYSLCIFGKTSQRSISGGSEINLGHWHEWIGPPSNRYSKMKYDRGLTCWNGPARNTVVNLRCGKDNQLISVKEPNRCEYSMEFTTPALCNPNADNQDTHDEL